VVPLSASPSRALLGSPVSPATRPATRRDLTRSGYQFKSQDRAAKPETALDHALASRLGKGSGLASQLDRLTPTTYGGSPAVVPELQLSRNPLVVAPEHVFPDKPRGPTPGGSDRADFQIFVDCAQLEEGAEAAVLLRLGTSSSRSSSFTLSCHSCYTALDTKLIAINLAIYLARNLRIWDNPMIFSNNQ
ncbi:hypothetical protein FRC11_012228, partial [Ceratobasidium sp. 423]